MQRNKNVYSMNFVVRAYAREAKLQAPERTIFSLLADRWTRLEVLDIGVGGGRTALHLAKGVRRYVGVDYSEEMVNTAKRRFPEYRFQHADARALPFPDASFDFVFFGFNGIDYVEQQDRLRILQEMRRVCRAGGMLCFSSHNLSALDHWPIREWLAAPLRRIWKLPYALLLFLLNGGFSRFRRMSHAMITDGAHLGLLRTYYIRPEAQLSQLAELGLSTVQAFQLEDGQEFKTREALCASQDDWVYYLCRR